MRITDKDRLDWLLGCPLQRETGLDTREAIDAQMAEDGWQPEPPKPSYVTCPACGCVKDNLGCGCPATAMEGNADFCQDGNCHASGGEEQCDAQEGSLRYFCVRAKGHAGNHIACSTTDHNLATWK